MERWVCARRTVAGDPGDIRRRLRTEIVTLLQVASRSEVTRPAGDGSFDLVLRSPEGRLSRHVTAVVGQAADLGSTMRIPLTWHATGIGGPLFPAFDGAVEVEAADSRLVSLAIVGAYRPPASIVGAVIDAAGLSHLAEATVEALTTGLAAALAVTVLPRPEATGHRPMTVGQVMTPDPLTLTEDTSLRTAANLLLLGRISGNPVVDAKGRLIGVLSESDLLDKVAPVRAGLGRGVETSWRHHDAITVGEACSRPARTTSTETAVRDAAGLMARHRIGRLIVLRGAEVAGIITRRDVLKALARSQDVIEQAVLAEVADGGPEDDVQAEVQDGMVRLTGQVRLLSDVSGLVRRLESVEGVISVDADALTWAVDDVSIPYPI